MGPGRVRAVFFDLDNTLVDTAGASRQGVQEVRRSFWGRLGTPFHPRPDPAAALLPLVASATAVRSDPAQDPRAEPASFPSWPLASVKEKTALRR